MRGLPLNVKTSPSARNAGTSICAPELDLFSRPKILQKANVEFPQSAPEVVALREILGAVTFMTPFCTWKAKTTGTWAGRYGGSTNVRVCAAASNLPFLVAHGSDPTFDSTCMSPDAERTPLRPDTLMLEVPIFRELNCIRNSIVILFFCPGMFDCSLASAVENFVAVLQLKTLP